MPASTTRASDLPGRVRGSLLREWDRGVRSRWGERAVQQVTADVRAAGLDVPDRIQSGEWYPSGLQIAITEAMLGRFLGDDPSALERVLLEDVRERLGRARLTMARVLGPGRLVAHAPSLFSHAYDVGCLENVGSGIGSSGAGTTLRHVGSPLFANPTWQHLQVAAWRTVFALTAPNATPRVRELERGSDCFVVELRW